VNHRNTRRGAIKLRLINHPLRLTVSNCTPCLYKPSPVGGGGIRSMTEEETKVCTILYSFRFTIQPRLLFQPIFGTTRGAHKRCSMSTPLVNHRPLKGKEDGIFIIAYTSTRMNPANCYRFENSTATSPILPLKNPHLVFRAALTLIHPHLFNKIYFLSHS